MSERPFFNKSAEETFDIGWGALKRGDRTVYEAALTELEVRSSRLATELAEELAAEGSTLGASLHGRTLPAGSRFDIRCADVSELAFVTDGEIVECRRQLIRSAEKTIWLSTYGLRDPDGELAEDLKARAKAGVHVLLFLSSKPARDDRVGAQLEYLERSGVKVFAKASHSKCVSCDARHVMIGSANLNTTYRDGAIYANSPTLAKHVETYLQDMGNAER